LFEVGVNVKDELAPLQPVKYLFVFGTAIAEVVSEPLTVSALTEEEPSIIVPFVTEPPEVESNDISGVL
jgi:hypothetical protein